jgi:hypothetical protein
MAGPRKDSVFKRKTGNRGDRNDQSVIHGKWRAGVQEGRGYYILAAK